MSRASLTFMTALCAVFLLGCQTSIEGRDSGDAQDEALVTRIGNFPGPDGPLRAAYIERNGMAVVGGDMLWPIGTSLSIRAATAAGPLSRWPGGIIPYENQANSLVFLAAVEQWNKVSAQTGITLVERTDEDNHILVQDGREGCFAMVGYRGGPQALNLAKTCPISTGIHEIGHAIGLIHEHQRPDRDSHIRINWDNVVGGETGEFASVNLSIVQGATNYSAYDYSSIMHYSNSVADAKTVLDPSKPLFEVIGSGPATIDNIFISPGDIAGVAAMYKGYGDEGPTSTQCAIDTCNAYSVDEGDCVDLNTGRYACEHGCLKIAASCDNPELGPEIPQLGSTFTCKNGESFPDYLCDVYVDCSDGSDESDCETEVADNSDYGPCTGMTGVCVDTTTTICYGALHTDYCPGLADEIRCCS